MCFFHFFFKKTQKSTNEIKRVFCSVFNLKFLTVKGDVFDGAEKERMILCLFSDKIKENSYFLAKKHCTLSEIGDI